MVEMTVNGTGPCHRALRNAVIRVIDFMSIQSMSPMMTAFVLAARGIMWSPINLSSRSLATLYSNGSPCLLIFSNPVMSGCRCITSLGLGISNPCNMSPEYVNQQCQIPCQDERDSERQTGRQADRQDTAWGHSVRTLTLFSMASIDSLCLATKSACFDVKILD